MKVKICHGCVYTLCQGIPFAAEIKALTGMLEVDLEQIECSIYPRGELNNVTVFQWSRECTGFPCASQIHQNGPIGYCVKL